MLALSPVAETAVLIDPWGHRSEQRIEHRTDPLTGAVASINTALGEKAKAFLGAADLSLLAELEETSKRGCPFCDATNQGTRYPPEQALPGDPGETANPGQLRRGNTVAVPNLFSKCARDSVVIIDYTQHVLSASKLGKPALADALLLAGELVRRARAQDPLLCHHVAGMNLLQPAGSSVPHPHVQVHARSVPYSGLQRLREAGALFAQRVGRSYWKVLLEEERALGERTIGTTGADIGGNGGHHGSGDNEGNASTIVHPAGPGAASEVTWLTPFAPAHQREVWGVLPEVGSLVELTEPQAAAFADGISRVVTAYEELGSNAFNFVFFSSPVAGDSATFSLQVRLCTRPAFRPLYSNYDTWFTPKFLGDDVHTEAPEQTAARLRARF